MKNLTKRQFEVLSFIARFIEEEGYSPCYEEIGEKLGFKSLSTTFAHIGNLEAKGWLTKGYGRSRSLQLTPEAEKWLAKRKNASRKVSCPKCEHKFEVRP